VAQLRTVYDSELGALFSDPNTFTYADLGARVGSAHDITQFSQMNPGALKVSQSRFHVLKPSDDTTWNWFPYSALRTYDAQQVAAGHAPIFVTATYAGKKRPVLWSWSLSLVNNVPTTPTSEWRYAVNVQDDRYIRFWLNRYVRPILLNGLTGFQNLWIGLDECAFNPDLYGVLDDSNHFVAGVVWDSPFPQTEDQYMASVNTFFARVKQLAPDVNLMPNSGSPRTWSKFQTAYASAPGIMTEEIYFPTSTAFYARDKIFDQYTAYSWGSSTGKAMVFRSDLSASDSTGIRSSLIAYLLLKGPNSFYAPRIVNTTLSLPPSAYSSIAAAIGNPVGSLQSQQEPGSISPGYRLYWRQYDNGIVYLNFTGVTKTINLTGQQYFDATGRPITQLIIPDTTGNYALLRGGDGTNATPRINPRLATPASGPLVVTITDPSHSGVIHYTLDGSTPTSSSPVYTAPLTLSSGAIVSARTTSTVAWSSFINQASYNVSAAPPVVQFATGSDIIPSGPAYPVVSLSAISAATIRVQYTARPTVGSPITGTLTFKPGDIYQAIPLNLTQNTTVTLSSPVGATLGGLINAIYSVQ